MRYLLLLTLLNIHLWAAAQNESNIPKLLETMAVSKNDTLKIETLGNLAKAYTSTSRQKAQDYSNQSVEKARKYGDNRWLIKALLKSSKLMGEIGMYKESILLLNEAVEHSQKYGFKALEIKCLSNLGVIYQELDINEKAILFMKKAHDMALATNDLKVLSIIDMNIGTIYMDTKDYPAAIKQFQTANTELIQQKNWNASVLTYTNIANSLCGLHEWDKALAVLDSAQLTVNTQSVDFIRKVELVENLAKAYLGKGNHNLSVKIISEFIETHGDLIPEVYLSNLHNLLAISFLKLDRNAEAIRHAEESIKLIDKSDVEKSMQISYLLTLAKCYGAGNNLQGSYETFMKLEELRDSVGEEERMARTNASLIAHEVESNERQLLLENNRLGLLNKFYVVALILISLLIISLYAYYVRNKKLTRSQDALKMQQEVAVSLEDKIKERTFELEKAHKIVQMTKEREVASLALLNQQHKDLLENIISRVKNWQELKLLSDPSVAKSLLQEVKMGIEKADEWGDFTLHFEKLHPTFFQTIQKNGIVLTSNELKHCAYMKIGMTRKQVAELMKCSEDAVKLSRNRIKKKIGLEADDSLQEYINAL